MQFALLPLCWLFHRSRHWERYGLREIGGKTVYYCRRCKRTRICA